MPRTPRYRITTVAEMTGIPAPTLRAWERRYGVPAPERTSSSYRLYSEADLRQVRRLRQLVDSGLAPSEAARLLAEPEPEPERPAPREPYAEALQRILDALDAFDPSGARREIARASYLGSASAVFDHVLSPAMRSIGQRWRAGDLSVGQEHLAAEVLSDAVRDLHRLVQPEVGRRLALLAAVSGEHHVLPLYGAAFRFALWGFRSEILGANTPPEAVATAVDALGPNLIGLSLTRDAPAAVGAPPLAPYARAASGRLWLLMGAAAPSHAAQVTALGGLCVGDDLADERSLIEAALHAPASGGRA